MPFPTIVSTSSSSSTKALCAGKYLATAAETGCSDPVTRALIGPSATPVIHMSLSSLKTASTILIFPVVKVLLLTYVSLYPQTGFSSTGLEAQLFYGDSRTGTYAFDPIGQDTVSPAGLRLDDQYFALINDTGAAGIFGLGFPFNSVSALHVFFYEHTSLFQRQVEVANNAKETLEHALFRASTSCFLRFLPSRAILGLSISNWIILIHLNAPMFTVTLQRNTISRGGNVGQLSIGELPAERGLARPTGAPNKKYPITWELFIDALTHLN
ncbi:uncharacterized protein BT62DRAFT_1013085 [Guyanagaster necrorhizus]|uniref:Uncharacterized protein n=1 Tax=Guyanagaster necrorhizus TaxID=856835 RepID=A0A9P7VHS5_9AGAR|nr:uncharacterized protein BT62DRAFT_1013085 [Guyanagaster necrorhizus MCA 3950]KAG7440174.1 hypothetical protein BT62DRAFT_1013085 [Guyanagaster necrorhizus MCA 3950]